MEEMVWSPCRQRFWGCFLFGTLPMGIDVGMLWKSDMPRILFDQGVELAFKKMRIRRFLAANNHVDQFFLKVG